MMGGRQESPVLPTVNTLDGLQQVLYGSVIRHQHPVTGLLPASEDSNHAWVRDNTYCALALWGLSMAVKKRSDLDEERAKTYEMEQRVVKCMRGLLFAMMRQKNKVEQFKASQSSADSLHAKYDISSGDKCVGDGDWGHLQIDATSLYLLTLAQMTAAGLQIAFTLDEVAFVQNLVFYVESAYFTPDYGVWERGDKTNHGLPELNASSIGMAKAAMEAMNELDLFGSHGGAASVIHVMPDEVHKCEAVLNSMLPRESLSKELDSALLSVISFPAFAVGDARILDTTRQAVIDKMLGKYGCKRFLRDGYMTCREDRNRLYYEPWELRMFDQIECQWPLFFAFLAIDQAFLGNAAGVDKYVASLERVMVTTADGQPAVPELYTIPEACVKAEVSGNGADTQPRLPVGRVPFFWAQSLYVLAKLLQAGLLQPSEMDPLNRRLCAEKKPDVVVQVAVLAENRTVQETMAREHDFHVQTVDEVHPVEIQPARLLGQLFTHLGRSKKLQLSGRPGLDVGTLGTSLLYTLQNQIFAFTPQFTDIDRFFFASDTPLVIDILMNEINFLQSSWNNMLGRPLVTIVFRENQFENGRVPPLFMQTFRKIKTGYLNGARVVLGQLKDFVNTSCMSSLEFLNDHEGGRSDHLQPDIRTLLDKHILPRHESLKTGSNTAMRLPVGRGGGVRGSWRRVRTAVQDSGDAEQQDSAFCLARRKSMRRMSAGDTDTVSASAAVAAEVEIYHRVRNESDFYYDDMASTELLAMLRDTAELEERGDILHYLAVKHGMSFRLETTDGRQTSVCEMYENLYEQSCRRQHWAMVRHTAGMLGRRLADLAKSVTDLLVRQKQLTVGTPPDERAILAPLPAAELTHMIHAAYGKDETTSMLTQELLLYMSMLIRTEPHLFSEMLRLRTGLIIQVMTGELQRLLRCASDEATEALVNLSPFQMKNLLYHILSGKDFQVNECASGHFNISSRRSGKVSNRFEMQGLSNAYDLTTAPPLGSSLAAPELGGRESENSDAETAAGEIEDERLGQWLRRRRLDGALNRVPLGFYPRLYRYLVGAPGVYVANRLLPHSLTEEMTEGEPKFALQIESTLTQIPEPEYRQLTVEALMVLTLLSEHSAPLPAEEVHVEKLVHLANDLFLADHRRCQGDAVLCCAATPRRSAAGPTALLCGGAAHICRHFYDSAPSGRFGTMLYLVRAMASMFNSCLPPDGVLDCNIC